MAARKRHHHQSRIAALLPLRHCADPDQRGLPICHAIRPSILIGAAAKLLMCGRCDIFMLCSHKNGFPLNSYSLPLARWTHWPLVAMANADNIRIETTSHSECTFLNVGRTSHPKRTFSVLPQPLLIKRKAVSRQRLLCNAK